MPKPSKPTEKAKKTEKDFPGKRVDTSGNIRYRIELNFEYPDRNAIHKGAKEEGCSAAEYVWRMTKLGMETSSLRNQTREQLNNLFTKHMESHMSIEEISRFLAQTSQHFFQIYDEILANQRRFIEKLEKSTDDFVSMASRNKGLLEGNRELLERIVALLEQRENGEEPE